MARRNTPFDWYLLDRKSLTDLLWNLAPSIVNKSITTSEFHQLIYTQIKFHLPVRVTKKIDSTIKKDLVYIGGMYYSDYDQMAWKSIEILFVYHSKEAKLKINAKRFRRICQCFADTVLHEMVHMRQFRRRSFTYSVTYTKGNLDQQYLGCTDEIDAYSFNIACELMEKYKNDQVQVIEHLNSETRKKKKDSWQAYLDAFNYNHNHRVIKRVKHRVMRYLPYAEIGKPFKTKKWLNY
jgi:hypothetical protein